MDHVAGATNRCANITMPSSHGAGTEQPRSHNTTNRKRNSRTIERRTSSMNEPFYARPPLHNRFPHYWFHGMQHAIPKLLDIPIWRRIHSGRAARMCIFGLAADYSLLGCWVATVTVALVTVVFALERRSSDNERPTLAWRVVTVVSRRTSRLSPLCGSIVLSGMSLSRTRHFGC